MESKTFLVVDDSATIRQLLTLTLRKFNGGGQLKIIEATDGREALEKVRMAEYDLVLTDIKMPNMDGLEFLHRVRSELENSSLPIVIISTKGEEEDVARGMALGATAYLTKPVSAPKLLETIGRILGQGGQD
ncbi:MAG TPA: response regulator [Blastocatellia bacterium]|nr:response regulator [Blastocatellia bacterium]